MLETGSGLRRLYVVVDGSMPTYTFAPQAIHAVTEFALADPESFKLWHDDGNTVIILEASDGAALNRLRIEATHMGFSNYSFFEPDWSGNTPSAVAFTPDTDVQGLLSDLPTAKAGNFMKERKRTATFRKRWARS